MIEIPVKVGVSVEETNAALLKAIQGDLSDLNKIVGAGGRVLKFDAQFRASGAKEFTFLGEALDDVSDAAKRAASEALKLTRVQEGSLTSIRQQINFFKQQRDALLRGSEAWNEQNTRLLEAQKAYQAAQGIQQGSISAINREQKELQELIRTQALNTQERYNAVQALQALNAEERRAQGIQRGSLADLKARRSELISLRDATNKIPPLGGPPMDGGGPTWNELNKQIQQIDGEINKLTPSFNRLLNVFGQIATVQAGFVAVASAVSAVGGAINAYVNRTKQIEAFNLALQNVGVSQLGVSVAFRDATDVANRLGAPLQQVEASYKRMVPALRAVGASTQTTSKFIENITARTQTLGLNTEESGRLLEAFAQVLAKGKLQSEELNQQISELDGAFRTQLADALGVSVSALTELVEQGQVTAPVFVDAVNRMANGTEELTRRVKEGTATIQQLQNIIANINTQTLTSIGKAIEPAIKSFLEIGRIVAQFFQEFSKTETFRVFATILNQTAQGLEVFFSNLSKLLNILNTLLAPFAAVLNAALGFGESFGGLIGIIINLGGAILLLRGAVEGLLIFNKVKDAVTAFGKSMVTAGTAATGFGNAVDSSKLQGFEKVANNIKLGGAGIADSLKNAAASFIGFNRVVGQTSEAVSASVNATNAASSSIIPLSKNADQLAGKLGFTGEKFISFNKEMLELEQSYKKVTVGQTQFGSSLSYGASQTTPMRNGLNSLRGAAQATRTSFVNLSNSLKGFRAVAVASLSAGLAELLNPLNIAILAVTAAFTAFQKGQEGARKGSEGAAQAAADHAEAMKRLDNLIKGTSKTSSSSTKTTQETTKAIQQASNAASGSATGWGALSAGLFAGAAALTVLSGGLGAPIAGFLALGGAAAAAAGGFVAASKAGEQLEKSEYGKALLNTWKQSDKQIKEVTSKIEGLGGKIGMVDFSNFANGSKSLQVLGNAFDIQAAKLEGLIAAEQKRIQQEMESEKPRQDVIDGANAQIGKYQQLLAEVQKSQKAYALETARRIANGQAIDAQKISLEQLTQAQKEFDSALGVAVTEAKVKAIEKYGQTLAQNSQLEAANIGIQLAAAKATETQRKRELAILEEKRKKNGSLTKEETEKYQELTKVVGEESVKRAELERQAQEGIVKAFEAGIKKAQELADVAGRVIPKLQGISNAIASGGQSGVQAILGTIDAIAERELEGLDKYDLRRKEIIQSQLEAQIKANEFENKIAQVRLRTQNLLAVNEAKIQQIRLQAEAAIAAARGDNVLAGALLDAAAAQGEVIEGLRVQYEIEKGVLELQKQQKDQQVIARAEQEGISSSVYERYGIEKRGIGEITSQMDAFMQRVESLQRKYDDASVKASDLQVATEKTSIEKANQEAEQFKRILEETSQAASNLEGRLKGVAGQLSSAVGQAQRLQSILNSGGTPARAMGGPVASGQQYLVNDGGGREAFLNRFGSLRMLPAGRNIKWTAPTSGTVIPAHLVDSYRRNAVINNSINAAINNGVAPSARVRSDAMAIDSGNLVKRIKSAVTGDSTNQRITNNITIQSQEPVMDASRLMANVSRARLRGRRF